MVLLQKIIAHKCMINYLTEIGIDMPYIPYQNKKVHIMCIFYFCYLID